METKPIIEKVVVSVVTAIVLGVGAFFMGVFEKGSEAINRDQIEAVVKEVMVTDAGKTYSQRLSEINVTLGSIDTKLETISDDVEDLEDAVLSLAGE